MKQRIIVERFESSIIQDGKASRIEFEVGKDVQHVLAIQLSSDNDAMPFHRGTLGMTLNGSEVFPEGWQAKKLMAGLNVSPNDRMYNLQSEPGLPRGNGKVVLTYQDNANALQAYGAYLIHVYVKSTVQADT